MKSENSSRKQRGLSLLRRAGLWSIDSFGSGGGVHQFSVARLLLCVAAPTELWVGGLLLLIPPFLRRHYYPAVWVLLVPPSRDPDNGRITRSAVQVMSTTTIKCGGGRRRGAL